MQVSDTPKSSEPIRVSFAAERGLQPFIPEALPIAVLGSISRSRLMIGQQLLPESESDVRENVVVGNRHTMPRMARVSRN